MAVSLRTTLPAVVASAVLGGCIGSFVTAATTSQASPQAIAAAVQRVRDTTAEKDLQTIGLELLPLNELLTELKEAVEGVERQEHRTCTVTARTAAEVAAC